ncbi:MAG: type II toxin-antitoxin system VapC family toxin [Chloroflexota bacterium]
MAIYYFDTSALVKLYIPEVGSDWVDWLVNSVDQNGSPANMVVFAKIGIAEVAAALARQARLGSITAEKRTQLYRLFLGDSGKIFETLAITDQVIHLAADLTQRAVLKGYDAVHLASAWLYHQRLVGARISPLIFVSADEKLCMAAGQEGLKTENPNFR